MKYFSMFSGIGGFELGIQQAYVDISTRERNEQGRVEISENSAVSEQEPMATQPLCIGFSEIDKYAIQIYEKQFNHKNYGDATRINAAELPDFELLVGGFPCQAFSIAGKRGGLEDSRGTLFYDIARIAKEKRPQHLLLENVKGLLSHDNGRTFKLIISTFAELGYNLEWQVLNSKNFGVPQNRERVFIIGHLGACCGRQVFPIRSDSEQTSFSGVYTGTLTSRYPASQREGTYIEENGNKARPFIQNPKMMNYKKDYENSVAITATSYKEPPVVNSIRRLTPTECERLQGYPDGWTKGVSDTQRYKTLGNSVTVNVIEYIIKQMYDLR